MSNMRWEIHAQPNRNDKSVARDHIHSQTPEVHEPSNLNDGSSNTENDNAGAADTSKENKDCQENC